MTKPWLEKPCSFSRSKGSLGINCFSKPNSHRPQAKTIERRTTPRLQSPDKSNNHSQVHSIIFRLITSIPIFLHGPYARWGLSQEDWEVWAALEDLYQAGRTTMIGVSNVQAVQLQRLCERANVKPMWSRTAAMPYWGGTKKSERSVRPTTSCTRVFRCSPQTATSYGPLKLRRSQNGVRRDRLKSSSGLPSKSA